MEAKVLYFAEAHPSCHDKAEVLYLAEAHPSYLDKAKVLYLAEAHPSCLDKAKVLYFAEAHPSCLDKAEVLYLAEAHPSCLDKAKVLYLAEAHPSCFAAEAKVKYGLVANTDLVYTSSRCSHSECSCNVLQKYSSSRLLNQMHFQCTCSRCSQLFDNFRFHLDFGLGSAMAYASKAMTYHHFPST